MIAFPDTSFLCAIYRQQVNSREAATYFAVMPEPLHVSSLLLYEFRQSARFQVWLRSKDKSKGYSQAECVKAFSDLESDLNAGVVVAAAVDWADVNSRAEDISRHHTISGGHRALDILHIATALHLGAKEFLTFDANQRKLAAAQKLKVKP